MAHWFFHSKLKTLYYNELFEQKIFIGELEGSFTGAPMDASDPKVAAVDVEANDDEDIIEGSKISKIYKSGDEMEIYLG